ncbi:MAG: acetyltransferase [Neisseria sp.]|nr:acetyltransferase [Neisseria sp.]
MKNLIIIGARGFGREIFNLANACNVDNSYKIKGFLDDNTRALVGLENYPPILSNVEDYKPQQNDIFVCALGDVFDRKKYTDIILEKNGCFVSLIHPNATIYTNAKIGERAIISDRVLISCDTVLGDDIIVHTGATIGHDVTIGNNCSLGANVFLGGFSKLENYVTLHLNCSVLPHKTVREKCVVGVNSVIMKNTKANTTLHGNPATILF